MSWTQKGKKWKWWQILFSWAPKSLRMLAPWKKSYDKPRQHIKRQRHHFADKGLSSQSCGFSVVIYRCENGTIMKAERQRIDAFRLWCLRRLLRIPWTAKRSNQSILKEVNPDVHWKNWCWSANTSAIWCEGPTHWKRPWCWERLMAGEEGGKG